MSEAFWKLKWTYPFFIENFSDSVKDKLFLKYNKEKWCKYIKIICYIKLKEGKIVYNYTKIQYNIAQ